GRGPYRGGGQPAFIDTSSGVNFCPSPEKGLYFGYLLYLVTRGGRRRGAGRRDSGRAVARARRQGRRAHRDVSCLRGGGVPAHRRRSARGEVDALAVYCSRTVACRLRLAVVGIPG